MSKFSTARHLDNLDLFYFWALFQHCWWYVIGAMLFAGALAWIICRYIVPPSYTSTVTLFAYDGDKAPGENGESKNAQMEYRDIIFGEKLVNDYRELLKSKTLQAEVKASLDRELPDLAHMGFEFLTKIERNTRFIYLSVVSHSPEKSRKAAQITAEKFRDKVQKFMNMKYIQIIDEANLPESPSAPRIYTIVIVSVLLAALAVYLFFFLHDFFNYTVRDPEEIKNDLNLPTLGTLPVVSGGDGESASAPKLILADHDKNKYIYLPAYEDFKLIRTNLQYSLPNTGKARVLLLTSAQPGDGKSFVAANLADTIAESGKKVLLINTDLRKPTTHMYFDLHRQPGLVDILLNEISFDKVIHRNVGGKTLDVITGGPIPPDPTSVIELFVESGILERERANYDYIIIDSPPCLTMADSLLSGKLADGVILVARSCATSVNLVKQTLVNLSNAKLKVLGMILNCFAPEKSRYGYYGKYGYGRYGVGKYGYSSYYQKDSGKEDIPLKTEKASAPS